jgi:hypothetical protein
MTTWLLPPRSGTTYKSASGTVYAGTAGIPVSFEDNDIKEALAQGWVYSNLAPYDQLGKLLGIPANLTLENNGDIDKIYNSFNPPIDIDLAQQRQINIDNWLASPLIPAIEWTAGEAIATGDIRRMPNGKTITYQSVTTISAAVNFPAGYIAGASVITIDAVVGTFTAGVTALKFANHSTVYLAQNTLSAPGNLTISPSLTFAVGDNAVISANITGTVAPVLSGRSTINADVSSTTLLTVSSVIGDPIGIGSEIMTGGVTRASFLTNAAVNSGVGSIAIDTGIGTISSGNTFRFGNHSTIYTASSTVTGSGTLTFTPNTTTNVPNNVAVTTATIISALGTGTGGAGTYTLTGNSVATVAATNMAVLTNPQGRAVTDGATVGFEDYITKTTTDENSPLVMYTATANLTEVTARYDLTRLTLGSPDYTLGNTLLYLRSKCGVDGVFPFVAGSIDYRLRNTINVNFDSFAAAYGYPIGMSRSNGSEFEFIVTDVAFGLEFNSGTGGNLYTVMVNGKYVNGSPVRTNNGNSQVIVYDFDGKLTRAVVRLRPCIVAETRIVAVHISPIGKIENGVKSQDTLLCLGDSMWDTISPVSNGQGAYNSLGINLKNKLGFDGVCVANGGGTGYVATAGNFTLPQMVSDSVNRSLFASYNVSHVVIGASLNDNSQTPSTVAAAALLTWQTLRATLPNAKITVCDAWYHDQDDTLTNRRAIATALRAQFNAWGDPNSRFISFHGADGTNSIIFGAANSTTLNTSTAAGTRAKVIGIDNTHFNFYGVSFMSDYLTNAIYNAWNGNY